MITLKIQCVCGQRYAFDVEPVGGRMPSAVACPVCGADGTAAANQMIAQSLPPQPVAAPAPAAAPAMRMAAAPPAAAAAPRASTSPLSPLKRLAEASDDDGGEKWKWWYFVLAGLAIGGYSIWQAYNQHRIKPLGELFIAVLAIAIGIWDFQHKRKKKRMAETTPDDGAA